MNETAVQQQVRLAAAYVRMQLWRNNSGAFQDETGRMIRFGLGNDSAELNKKIKSSDLIGATPVLITSAHVGRTLGVFTALECKKSDWTYTGKDREPAQLKFHDLVREVGGFAGFISDPSQLEGIIKL